MIRKFQWGGFPINPVEGSGAWLNNNNNISLKPKNKNLSDLGVNVVDPPSRNIASLPNVSQVNSVFNEIFNNKLKDNSGLSFTILLDSNQGSMTPLETKQISKILLTAGIAANAIASQGVDYLSSKLFNSDADSGRIFGSLFSQGATTVLNSIGNNLLNGSVWSDNVLKDTGASLAGTAVGIGANYLGQGINKVGGNTWRSRFVGQSTATGVGTVGGLAASNLVKYGTLSGRAADGSKVALVGKSGQINPYTLVGTMVGEGLAAANGPKKEYEGRYGKAVKTSDDVFEAVKSVAGAFPGWGQIMSTAMSLNKGLHGTFGGTSAMTKNDAFLGSYFTPFGALWANVWNSHTTDKFGNYNLHTNDKVMNFIGDAYGNTAENIRRAAEESNKTYGGGSLLGFFDSTDEYEKALKNIELMNKDFPTLMALAQKNYLLGIKAFDMSSINNQRYALNINGGFKSLAIGKQGMKILSNAVNHNIGMRLLSAAALIDNKQAILCSAVD